MSIYEKKKIEAHRITIREMKKKANTENMLFLSVNAVIACVIIYAVYTFVFGKDGVLKKLKTPAAAPSYYSELEADFASGNTEAASRCVEKAGLPPSVWKKVRTIEYKWDDKEGKLYIEGMPDVKDLLEQGESLEPEPAAEGKEPAILDKARISVDELCAYLKSEAAKGAGR